MISNRGRKAFGASPVMHGGRVYLVHDNKEDAYVPAFLVPAHSGAPSRPISLQTDGNAEVTVPPGPDGGLFPLPQNGSLYAIEQRFAL